MIFRVPLIALVLLLSFSASAISTRKTQAAAPSQKTSKPQAAKSTATQTTQAQPPAAVQPAPPRTPEQGPSSPPQVTFQDGQLTIEARNSTMSDVLNAVKQKTGAAVDMPAVSSERVVGRFGPGAPRDVMAQLLNGSHYDYVLLGSPADPGALKKIVLMARAAGPEPAPAPVPEQRSRAYQENQNLQAVPEVDNDQSTAPDDVSTEIQQPPDEESQQPDQNLQQEQPQPGQPVVKTPEQLLRELQQQQQQQQQQNPAPQ